MMVKKKNNKGFYFVYLFFFKNPESRGIYFAREPSGLAPTWTGCVTQVPPGSVMEPE